MKSFLPTLLNVLGVLSLVSMLILAWCHAEWPYEFEPGKEYYSSPNWSYIIIYILTGIISCLFLMSLSRIVEACNKYIERN